jgi:hypothetical protein
MFYSLSLYKSLQTSLGAPLRSPWTFVDHGVLRTKLVSIQRLRGVEIRCCVVKLSRGGRFHGIVSETVRRKNP